MNLNPNGTMFLSITTVDEATHRYMVCLHATPPHIVSDGLWGSGATNRKPVKSFLPLFELQDGKEGMDHCHIGIAITHILCLFNDLVVALVSHTVISFAVISSLLSELQIQNSELGKLALSSALISDILCTIATAIGTAVMITENSNVKDVIRNVLALICLAIFNPLVCRPTMLWIIKHTPEGRAVKDGYVYLIIVMLFILEGPPLGSALVKKLNFLGTTFLLPIFVTISHACLVPSLYCNMQPRDAVSLALILNCKGVVEVGLYCFLYDTNFLYDPSRKFAGYQKRNIMNLKPWSELRILMCIHKPSHISSMYVLDLCCPTTESPIIVDVLHLIELVERALPIFIPHRIQRQASGLQHKSYSDEHDNPDAVSAYPCTAIAPPNLMVLELSPCSVGILVTRASHQTRYSSTRLALIYLSEHDDEEALCIARRAIRNPGMNIVIYNLVFKAEDDEWGQEVDDDELEDVKHAREHNIRYQQIIETEGSQTAAFLSDIVKEHDFFIVGRRHGNGIESPQTDGLTDWSEFPELGAIGDFLASPDLESRASILVVQQQLSP
ncbi:Cation/H(+) antiporter 3 [Glycine soja]|nr:Cation/H(+) antiporter 3 [Glycine soja]